MIEDVLERNRDMSGCMIPSSVFRKLKSSRSFIIFGTGKSAEYAINECKQRGLFPKCICDSFSHEDETFMGIQLLSQEDALKSYGGCTVLVCVNRLYKVAERLRENNVDAITWNNTDLMTGNFIYGKDAYTAMSENIHKINRVYEMLSDEKSRKVYMRKLEYLLTLEPGLLQDCYDKNYYFGHDIIGKVKCGSFVDCGAFNGDTLQDFVNRGCRCNSYFAIEADRANCYELNRYIEENNYSFVKVIETAVWNESTVLHFSGNGEPSERICEDGGKEVRANSLDNLLGAKADIDFIKMDIEGAEIKALIGTSNIIKKQHPILAISIYHSKNDMWDIPLLIKRLNPNYNLYIRHHTDYYPDTVCYAIYN